MSGESSGSRPRAGTALSLAILAVAIGASVGPRNSQAVRRSDPQGPAEGPIELWIDNARIPEGDSGSTTCMFTLHLSVPAADTVTVSVATFDSTATAADFDYEPVSLQVTFAPGSTAESLGVHVLGDRKFEPDEYFGV